MALVLTSGIFLVKMEDAPESPTLDITVEEIVLGFGMGGASFGDFDNDQDLDLDLDLYVPNGYFTAPEEFAAKADL